MRLLVLTAAMLAVTAHPGRAVEPQDTLALLEVARFGGGNQPEDVTFAGMGDLVVPPGAEEIFVVEPVVGREIRVLSFDGELLRTIGRQGRGPGEFSRVPALGVFEDTLLAAEHGRLLTFTVDGSHVRTVQLEGDVLRGIPLSLSRGPDGWVGHFAGTWQTPDGEESQHRLYRLDPVTGTALRVHATAVGSDGPMWGPPARVLSGSHLVAESSPGYRIAFLGADGSRVERTFTMSSRSVSDSDVEDFRDARLERCGSASDQRACRQRVDDLVRDARAAVGDAVPPIARLVATSDGCVLVKRRDLDSDLSRSGSHEPYDHVCVESERQQVVIFPAPFTPRWLADSIIWGWESGPLDVPILVGYRITG